MNIDKIVKSAIKSFLIISTAGAMISTTNVIAAQQSERCYGIAKAGMNDCPTAKTACAGTSTQDNQPDAFILLPPGTCNKIAGASLNPPKSTKKK